MNILLSPISCIIWIVMGGIAGALARQMMASRNGGFLSDIILGIVGGIVGGFILGLFHISLGGILGDLIAAIVGACILIGVGRMIMGRQATV